MEVDGLAVFLQYHCVPLFTDIDELSNALHHFSDADLFISRLYSTTHVWMSFSHPKKKKENKSSDHHLMSRAVYCFLVVVVVTTDEGPQ